MNNDSKIAGQLIKNRDMTPKAYRELPVFDVAVLFSDPGVDIQ